MISCYYLVTCQATLYTQARYSSNNIDPYFKQFSPIIPDFFAFEFQSDYIIVFTLEWALILESGVLTFFMCMPACALL